MMTTFTVDIATTQCQGRGKKVGWYDVAYVPSNTVKYINPAIKNFSFPNIIPRIRGLGGLPSRKKMYEKDVPPLVKSCTAFINVNTTKTRFDLSTHAQPSDENPLTCFVNHKKQII